MWVHPPFWSTSLPNLIELQNAPLAYSLWPSLYHGKYISMFLLNQHWHELWKQEKCPSLAPPRGFFFDSMSLAGFQINPVDVNFHLQKSLEFFDKKSAVKIWSRSKKDKEIKIFPLMLIKVKQSCLFFRPEFYQEFWIKKLKIPSKSTYHYFSQSEINTNLQDLWSEFWLEKLPASLLFL